MAKTYRVTGTQTTLGHPPGSTFEADIPENLERQLLESGALSVSRAKQPDEKDPAGAHEGLVADDAQPFTPGDPGAESNAG
jgi:hypothetical protein